MAALLLLMPLSADTGIVSGSVEPVAEGFQFTEGPLWLGASGLIFSDIPADTIYRADKSVWRQPSGQANGLTLDPQGRVIACEHQTRRISRTEADGTVVSVGERFDGKRLNSPNDVICRSDGVILFTDPPYGLKGGLSGPEAELDFAGVFAILPDATLKLLGKDFKKPNGIALSPDEKILYVADTESNHIRAFDLAADATVSNGRVFAEVQHPDGLKVDVQGNLWCTSEGGVQVLSTSGAVLGTVSVPQQPSNCAFGEADGQTLYITARSAVYKVRTVQPGLRPGPKADPAHP